MSHVQSQDKKRKTYQIRACLRTCMCTFFFFKEISLFTPRISFRFFFFPLPKSSSCFFCKVVITFTAVVLSLYFPHCTLPLATTKMDSETTVSNESCRITTYTPQSVSNITRADMRWPCIICQPIPKYMVTTGAALVSLKDSGTWVCWI